MKPTYHEALACNIQHYLDRGNTLEHALIICLRPKEEVFRVYGIIQEEKRRGYYPHTNALPLKKDSNAQGDILEAER